MLNLISCYEERGKVSTINYEVIQSIDMSCISFLSIARESEEKNEITMQN